MLQAGAEACGTGEGAVLVCFLQVLASGILLSHPCSKIEGFFLVPHQLPNDARLEKNSAPGSTQSSVAAATQDLPLFLQGTESPHLSPSQPLLC